MAARSATLVDKLALVPHALIGLSVGILRLAARPLTHDANPPTAFKDFVYAVLRYVLANSTVPQEKWMLPTTDKAYLAWTRGKSLQPDTTVLASGLKIHWIGEIFCPEGLPLFPWWRVCSTNVNGALGLASGAADRLVEDKERGHRSCQLYLCPGRPVSPPASTGRRESPLAVENTRQETRRCEPCYSVN